MKQERSFNIEFPNIFVEYVIKEALEKRINTWQTKPFHFWQTQLDFTVWCSTSGCGISIDHLNSSLPMLRSVYRFHVYFQIRKILKELRVVLPYESEFKKYNNRYDQTRYNKIICRVSFKLSRSKYLEKSIFFLNLSRQ